MYKRAISLFVCLCLAIFMVPAVFAQGDAAGENGANETAAEPVVEPGLANFTRGAIYESGMFADVPEDVWYSDSVKNAYELSLMQGASDNMFNADGNLTIAETVTMAARLHSIYYTGKPLEAAASDPWYKPYMEYALKNGIITQYSSAPNGYATRAYFASVLCAALPDEALSEINTIEDNTIPDVSISDNYAKEIYKLYRAGVLTGNDGYGTFTPYDSIKRSAVSAIVSRMADAVLRKNVSLLPSLPALTGLGADISSDGNITVKWNETSWGSHKAMYEVYISGAMAYVYNSADAQDKYKTSFTIAGAKADLTYIVKARAYIEYGGEKYYGAFCEPVNITFTSPSTTPPTSVNSMYAHYPDVPDFGVMASLSPKSTTQNSYTYVYNSEKQPKLLENYCNLLLANGYSLSAGDKANTYMFYKKSISTVVAVKASSTSEGFEVCVSISKGN